MSARAVRSDLVGEYCSGKETQTCTDCQSLVTAYSS
jgi:hypothetical protein